MPPPDEHHSATPSGLHPVAFRDLQPGMVVELVNHEMLLDTSTVPLRHLRAGDRLTVLTVTKIATGQPDREPYDVTFRSDTGSTVSLEVESGDDVLQVVTEG